MDIARRPYTTDARFFKDSEQVVKIRWYPVTEPVECLPFPSKINSLDWSSHPWIASGVGEVYGEPRPFNGAKALPYAKGLTPCQPAAVFVDGEVLDPEKPPQIYNADQFPACCLNVWTPRGGIEWGGTGVVTPTNTTFGPSCSVGPQLNWGVWYRIPMPASTTGFSWLHWGAPLFGVTATFRIRVIPPVFGYSGSVKFMINAFGCTSQTPLTPVTGSIGLDAIYTWTNWGDQQHLFDSGGSLTVPGSFLVRLDRLS